MSPPGQFEELAIDWHLDEDFKPVGGQLVWQRLAALCDGDMEIGDTRNRPGSVGRGTAPPAQRDEPPLPKPVQAKEVEIELTAAADVA
jgi:hypothetical protein